MKALVKGYIFDLDGTIYLDNNMIDGAAEAIAQLKKRGDKVVFLTNKSISTRNEYVEKLGRMGIQTKIDEVINSNLITAIFLKKNILPGEKVYVIGEKPLLEELINEGISLTDNCKDCSYVVIGWDRQFNYEKLCKAYEAWENKAIIIATNPDRTCPINKGQIPDCGSMIGAIEGATGEPIDLITGKPSKILADYVVNQVLGLPPSQCFMIGDRLETDILMGNENGMNSVLVMTGITNTDMLHKSLIKPTYILKSVKEIVTI